MVEMIKKVVYEIQIFIVICFIYNDFDFNNVRNHYYPNSRAFSLALSSMN
jgi:hypothetical protein